MPSKTIFFFVVVVRGNSLELMGSKDCSPLWWGEWGGGGGAGAARMLCGHRSWHQGHNITTAQNIENSSGQPGVGITFRAVVASP